MKIKFLLVCLAFLSGQAMGVPKKAPAPAFDPVPAFEQLMAVAGSTKEWSVVYQNSRNQKWARRFIRIGEATYDVKKTDSLVNPIVGLVKFPVEITQSELRDTEEAAAQETLPAPKMGVNYFMTGTFHASPTKWTLQNFSYRMALANDPKSWSDGTLTPPEIIDGKSSAIGTALQAWIK